MVHCSHCPVPLCQEEAWRLHRAVFRACSGVGMQCVTPLTTELLRVSLVILYKLTYTGLYKLPYTGGASASPPLDPYTGDVHGGLWTGEYDEATGEAVMEPVMEQDSCTRGATIRPPRRCSKLSPLMGSI